MLLMSAAGGLLIAVQAPPIVAVDGSVKLLSDAYNSSGQELFSRLADTPGNIAFSPYSVGTAMALALSGARGDTEAEMLRILKHNLSRAEIDGANGKAIAILNRYGRGPLFFSKPAKLTTANAILLTTDGGNLISNDYLAAIKTLWTNDVASYAGPFTLFKDVHTGPRPLRSPHPPIWVGGSSDAALRRAALYGDAWHPNRVRMDWLRDTGLPRLREIAAAERKRAPALCPRIRLQLTESPRTDEQRLAGQGTLDQVRKDLEALESLGAEYVLLDSAGDDPEATRHHEPVWRMLTMLAEKVLDLPQQTLR